MQEDNTRPKLSFCECVYRANRYREVRNEDPQRVARFRPILTNFWNELPSAPTTQISLLWHTTYLFPWRRMGLSVDDVVINFWFDEVSGEMMIAYLRA